MILFRSSFRFFILSLFSAFFVFASLNPKSTQEKDDVEMVENFVKDLYKLVSFSPNNLPDWDKVKAKFLKEAVIILYNGQDTYNIHSRESFIEDFINFIKNFEIETIGFNENVVSCKTKIIGNMAHCLVLYEASIPGRQNPPQKGIDSFQLLKRGGEWLIVSVTNEIVRPGVPIPEELIKVNSSGR